MNASKVSDLSIEPSAIRGLSPGEKDRLTEILDRYLVSLENGMPLGREELLAANPDLAAPLQTYFNSIDELHNVAAGFASPPDWPPRESEPADGDTRRLGDFRLIREIGRGGMGVVYEAQQISLGRRVALKVLPFAAVLDAKQIARFKHEAKAAAQLLHPNIVSVFAVGVERGVHYYAMQLIDGQPLDRAIAERRRSADVGPLPPSADTVSAPATALGAETDANYPSTCNSFLTSHAADPRQYFRTIVRLGIQAADALHAAHEHGIIHRDIKPSNLLLDGDGKLWVTDFGLARCLTDAPLTKTGDIVGTMRYMSPEQARGQSALVDQRTDVYSLGVTLYEMLVLQPAFSADDGPGLLRRIDQEEPRRMRLLQPKIPADLETVVMKAMAKRREDRYTTAREFAEDLGRVLDGKPTIARPPTLPDRLGKWARRHTRIVATVAAVGLLAMLGMAASTMLITREKIRAEKNYDRAERHFREAQEAVDRLGVQVAQGLANVPGADQVRKELLQETVRYYRDFVEQAAEDPVLRADLALTYSKIGTLAGEMGSSEEAIAAHQLATGLFEQLAAEHPGDPDYRRQLAICRNTLGLALSRSGRTDLAHLAYDDAIRLQKDLVAGAEDSGLCLGELARSENNLGLLQIKTGSARAAVASFREAIALQKRLLAADPDNPERLQDLAASWNNLSTLYVDRQPSEAVPLYEEALAYRLKAAAARPAELKYRSDVALTYNNLGSVQSRIGRLADAVASYEKAIEIQCELVHAAPAQRAYRQDLSVSFNNLGLARNKLNSPAEAERSFRRALDLQEAMIRENPGDVGAQSSLGGIHNNLGMVLEGLDRTAEAAESFRKAVEHQQIALQHAPSVSQYRLFLSQHYCNYGRVLRRLGHPDDAARTALARRSLWPNDPQHLFAVAEELALAAKLLAGANQVGMTEPECAESALETLRQAVAAGWKPPAGPQWTQSFAALKDHPGFTELVKH